MIKELTTPFVGKGFTINQFHMIPVLMGRIFALWTNKYANTYLHFKESKKCQSTSLTRLEEKQE